MKNGPVESWAVVHRVFLRSPTLRHELCEGRPFGLCLQTALSSRSFFEDTRASIENFRFHDLQHTTASYLVMSGASAPEVAEVLGHKDLQMVKRYAHLSKAHITGVLSRMTASKLGASIAEAATPETPATD